MNSNKYRLEEIGQNGGIRYNFVKDVQFKNKKSKVRKSISDLKNADISYDFELEEKAILKKAELVFDYYSFDYLEKSDVLSLEEKRWRNLEFFNRAQVDEIRAYQERFEKAYIHGTTMVEGNTLTYAEVSDLLDYDIIPKRTLQEVNEIQNYKAVRAFIHEFSGKITLPFIKKLHSGLMDKVLENPGSFRQGPIFIYGSDLLLTPPDLIEDDLKDLILKYYENKKIGKYPFEQIILFHYHFEMIHPFADGNGRVGREIFNYFLTKEKYPPFLIDGSNCEDYLSSLRLGNEGKYSEMIQGFYQMYQRQLSKTEEEFGYLNQM
jgi:Uncharacterized conserved protein